MLLVEGCRICHRSELWALDFDMVHHGVFTDGPLILIWYIMGYLKMPV